MEGKFYVGGLWKNIKFPLSNYGGEILCGGLEFVGKSVDVGREQW